jgi:hypothetical protein
MPGTYLMITVILVDFPFGSRLPGLARLSELPLTMLLDVPQPLLVIMWEGGSIACLLAVVDIDGNCPQVTHYNKDKFNILQYQFKDFYRFVKFHNAKFHQISSLARGFPLE